MQICRLQRARAAAHAEQAAAETLRAMAARAVRGQAMPGRAGASGCWRASCARSRAGWTRRATTARRRWSTPRASVATASNYSNNAVLVRRRARASPGRATRPSSRRPSAAARSACSPRGLGAPAPPLVSAPRTPIERACARPTTRRSRPTGATSRSSPPRATSTSPSATGRWPSSCATRAAARTRIVSPPATPGGSRSAYEPVDLRRRAPRRLRLLRDRAGRRGRRAAVAVGPPPPAGHRRVARRRPAAPVARRELRRLQRAPRPAPALRRSTGRTCARAARCASRSGHADAYEPEVSAPGASSPTRSSCPARAARACS